MVPPAISEQRLLGRGSFSFKACSHAGASDGSKRWQGQTWEVQSPPLSCSHVEDTKAHQSTNMFEPRTKFAFVNSCVFLRHLYYQTNITDPCVFLPFITAVGNLTSHWPSWVAWSSNHWKDLVLFSSLETPKGSGLVVNPSNSLVFHQIIWIKSGWTVGYFSLRCVFHYVSL